MCMPCCHWAFQSYNIESGQLLSLSKGTRVAHMCSYIEQAFNVCRGELCRKKQGRRRQVMAEITLQGVTKDWGTAQAVKGIDFQVQAGSFVVLLGPSGCGKSTTLRLISGLDTPTSGTIRIGDRDVTQLPPAKRRI